MRTLEIEIASLQDHKKNVAILQRKHEQLTSLECKQLSYINIPGDASMLGITIGQMLNQAARKYGDAEALVVPFQNIRLTFRELKDEVNKLAGGFISLGLKRGDRIAVWSPNTYECYVTQLAGWKAGFIVVSINAALQSREVLYALNKVGVRCIVISKVFRNQDFYKILTKSIPEIVTCKPGSLKSGQAPELEFVVSVEPDLIGTFSFLRVMEMGANNILADQIDLIDVQFDDVCALFYTSGTTGKPKAVMVSHHSLINNGYFVGKRLQLNENDRICLPVPLFHVYGCQLGFFAALQFGATTILPSYGYDPKAIAEVSATQKCTFVVGTPTMFTDVVKEASQHNYNWAALRSAVTGGAICPEQLIKDLKTKLNIKCVFSNYGMTEIGCAFLSLSDDPDSLISSTVGYPCPNCEVKLVDKFGRTVSLGEEGELCIRGYGVTYGYWGEPEKTSEVFSNRWFHTGDLFIMRESGHGEIVGRIKEMVNRGGENVYPKEVEDFLRTHYKILDAQVFGVPDPRMGEEPAVWIHVEEGQIMTVDEVKSFCKGQIAHFKIPRYVLFRDDFPKTPLGKCQKFRMREETIKALKL